MGTVAQVSTISVYPSLSVGDLDRSGIHVGTIVEAGTISAYLSLSKKGFGPTFAKLTVCEVELVQCWSNVGLIGHELGPKSNKVGSVDNGFGTKFDKVDIIGHPN